MSIFLRALAPPHETLVYPDVPSCVFGNASASALFELRVRIEACGTETSYIILYNIQYYTQNVELGHTIASWIRNSFDFHAHACPSV
jgi:hypothetical protein